MVLVGVIIAIACVTVSFWIHVKLYIPHAKNVR